MENEYDKRYDIRIAKDYEMEKIMEFIDNHWKPGHILARDKELFSYEFLEGNQINMVLAIERATGQIEGIFGFLYCSHAKKTGKQDIWGSLWKVIEPGNEPLLGIELAKRVYHLTGCRMHIGSGANPRTTIPLRRIFFQDKVGKMRHFYRLNQHIEEYKICKINKMPEIGVSPRRQNKVKPLSDIKDFQTFFNIEDWDVYPYKDSWYIEKRFYKYPYYKYQLYGIQENDVNSAVVICRQVQAVGAKALRIVDYLGNHDAFAGTSDFWKRQMLECGYEYVDFYEFGMREEAIKAAGFICRKDEDENVIPNYFEPFERKNADIWVHYKFEGTTFFKADCDQDRPNMI